MAFGDAGSQDAVSDAGVGEMVEEGGPDVHAVAVGLTLVVGGPVALLAGVRAVLHTVTRTRLAGRPGWCSRGRSTRIGNGVFELRNRGVRGNRTSTPHSQATSRTGDPS